MNLDLNCNDVIPLAWERVFHSTCFYLLSLWRALNLQCHGHINKGDTCTILFLYLLLNGNQSSGDMILSFVKSICTPAGHGHLHVYSWDARFEDNYANCTLSLHLRVLGIIVSSRFWILSCLRGVGPLDKFSPTDFHYGLI